MRCTDARWYGLPTSGYPRPPAVPFAWRFEPGAPRGAKNGNFRTGNWTAEAIKERRWLGSLMKAFAARV